MRRRRAVNTHEASSSFDLSVSDLMAALLLIFVLILAFTLLNLQQEYEQKSDIAERYEELQIALYRDLEEEFRHDLEEWGVKIDQETLAVRFDAPDVVFDGDSYLLKDRFATILTDFFPRYVAVLRRPEYVDSIVEIRLEGHTANEFGTEIYLENVDFSQKRVKAVLEHILGLDAISSDLDLLNWVQTKISASGFAYTRPIPDSNGQPNWELSRRVEFRVRTDAEAQIREMLDIGR